MNWVGRRESPKHCHRSGKKQSFVARWQNGGSFGQYKAVLDLSYGTGDDKLENTALVWILPWEKLLAIFGTLFILTIIAALWLHRVYENAIIAADAQSKIFSREKHWKKP